MGLYDYQGKLICNLCGNGNSYTNAQAKAAFLSLMNQKASDWGMSGTSFASPSGQTQSSTSTAQDLMKLAVAVSASPLGCQIWSTTSRSFAIGGPNARTLSITNSNGTKTATDNAGYKYLGGKGGSLIYSPSYHRAHLGIVDIDGRATAIGIMGYGQTAYNAISNSFKEVCDMVKANLDGETPVEGENLQTLIADGGGYAASIIPTVAPAYLNYSTPADLLAMEYAVKSGEAVSRYPASTSKTMTMLCALSLMSNAYENITIKTVDIETGSGSTFYNGDTLRLIDALQIMMMESSNTLAQAICRSMGEKLLKFSA